MTTVFALILIGGAIASVLALIAPRVLGGGRLRGIGIALLLLLVGGVGLDALEDPEVKRARQAEQDAEVRKPRIVRRLDGGTVTVWGDRDALREGGKLIDAGVHRTQPWMLERLIGCRVPSGTQVIVSDGGMFSSTVLVVAGRDAGCRGVVDNAFLVRRGSAEAAQAPVTPR